MKKPRPIPTIVAGLAAVLAHAPAPALGTPPLLGLNTTDTDSTLYDIDPATGAASNSRTLSYGNLIGMSFSAGGVLYTIADAVATDPTVFTIQPSTGAMTIIGSTGRANTEGDLDFDPTTGLLYEVRSEGWAHGVSWAAGLFLVDPTNGAATQVDSLGTRDLSAMAFDTFGTLFVVDTDADELLTIDPATAEVLSTTPLDTPLGDVAGMDFDPISGMLYVADGGSDGGLGSLYTVDSATGQVSTIGPTGLTYGLSGLVFVPEPGTCSLLLLGTLMLGRQCVREKRT